MRKDSVGAKFRRDSSAEGKVVQAGNPHRGDFERNGNISPIDRALSVMSEFSYHVGTLGAPDGESYFSGSRCDCAPIALDYDHRAADRRVLWSSDQNRGAADRETKPTNQQTSVFLVRWGARLGDRSFLAGTLTARFIDNKRPTIHEDFFGFIL